MARVAEGTGYWLQHGAETRQLAGGDGLITLYLMGFRLSR